MAEISLQDYLQKMELLLQSGAADEVTQHCAHILRFYPRHAAAYRLLGRALLALARYDEAGAAFRRVISVLPNDRATHLGLSEVYTLRKRGDEAIWHLERVFEQDPNDKSILEGLRDLYRRFRSVQPKIQLTAAAIAHQHVRNGRYEPAIETLRGALTRDANRVDLRVLLAQAQWNAGAHLDAAESAIEVLKTLPFCLDANRLLTQLWLSFDRPTDAQKFLSRVEDVDPYLAMELAGQPIPDDAFLINELDYGRLAQSTLTSERPAWLSDVPQEQAAAFDNRREAEREEARPSWLSSAIAALPTEKPAPARAPKPEPADDDWMRDLEPPQSAAAQRFTPRAAPMIEDDDPPFDDSFEASFDAVPAAAADDETPEWFSADLSGAIPKAPTAPDEEDDVPEWLAEAAPRASITSTGDLDEPNLDDLFGESFAAAPVRRSATSDLDEPSQTDLFGSMNTPRAPASSTSDLFAPTTGDLDDQSLGELFGTGSFNAASVDDAPDWLREASYEEATPRSDEPPAWMVANAPTETDGLAEPSFDDLFGDNLLAAPRSAARTEGADATNNLFAPNTGDLQNDELRDLFGTSSLPTPDDEDEDDSPDWLRRDVSKIGTGDLGEPPVRQAASSAPPDWLNLDPEADDPFASPASGFANVDDPFASLTTRVEEASLGQYGTDSFAAASADDAPDWLRGAESLASDDDDTPAWMRGEPTSRSDAANDFASPDLDDLTFPSDDDFTPSNAASGTGLTGRLAWEHEAPASSSTAPTDHDDLFALFDDAPGIDAPAPSGTGLTGMLSWENDARPNDSALTSDPDDLFASFDDAPAPSGTGLTGMLSWENDAPAAGDDDFLEEPLAGLDSPPANDALASSGTGLTGLLNWQQKTPAPVEDEVTLDDNWLSEFGTEDDPTPAQPRDEYQWLTAEDEPPEAAPLDDDWLTRFERTPKPAPNRAAPAESLPTWLNAVEPTSYEEEGDEVEVEPTTPVVTPNSPESDWLMETEMTYSDDPQRSQGGDSPQSDDDLLSGWSLDAEPAASDTPDWLQEASAELNDGEAEPVDLSWLESSGETPAVPAAGSEFDFAASESMGMEWMDEDDLALPAVSGTTVDPNLVPDWLQDMPTASAGALGAQTDELDAEIAARAASQVSDFAWGEPAATPEPISDTPDWLSELQGDTPVAETPDWLSEASPLGINQADDLTSAAADRYTTDESDMAAAFGETADDRAAVVTNPDWLADLGEPVSASTANQFDPNAFIEAELASLTDDDDDFAIGTTAVASDTPDWLTDLQGESVGGLMTIAEDDAINASDDFSFDTPAASLTDTPDWLADMQGETVGDIMATAEDDETNASDDFAFASAVTTDTPDWLADVLAEGGVPVAETPVEEGGFAIVNDAELAPTASPSWLDEIDISEMESATVSNLAAEDDGEFSFDNDAELAPAETPGWLNELTMADAEDELAASGDMMATTEDEDEFAFSFGQDAGMIDDSMFEGATATPAASDFSFGDEMTEAQANNFDFETDTDMVAAAAELPSWIETETAAADLDDTDGVVLAEADDEAFAMSIGEDPYATMESGEMESSDVINEAAAPDWLNAMVPGLDSTPEVDYDAEGELAYASNEVLPQPEMDESSSRIEWLDAIVEEETGVLAAASAGRRYHYTFTRLPAWLTPMGSGADADLPEWLRE